MSNIGRIITLIDYHYDKEGYADQFGRSHAAYILDDTIEITIVEIRNVPGMWGNGTYEGWKARSEDGRIFTCNWDIFPDDSMMPSTHWFDGKKTWWDISQSYGLILTEKNGKEVKK